MILGLPMWILRQNNTLGIYHFSKQVKESPSNFVGEGNSDFMERDATITSTAYCDNFKRLRRAIQNKRRGLLTRVLYLCIATLILTQLDKKINFWSSSNGMVLIVPIKLRLDSCWLSPIPEHEAVTCILVVHQWQRASKCYDRLATFTGGRFLCRRYLKDCSEIWQVLESVGDYLEKIEKIKLVSRWIIQRLFQNTVEFLGIHSLHHLLEFLGSWLWRAFRAESKERVNASVQ